MEIVTTPEGAKTWKLDILKDSIFDNVSTRTGYLNQRRAIEDRDDKHVLMDDDRGIFEKHFNGAIAKLVMMLGRGFSTELTANSLDAAGAHFEFSAGENNKDSISFSLDFYCQEFVTVFILSKWFDYEAEGMGINNELEEAETNIRSASRYQKHTIQRPIHPIF